MSYERFFNFPTFLNFVLFLRRTPVVQPVTSRSPAIMEPPCPETPTGNPSIRKSFTTHSPGPFALIAAASISGTGGGDPTKCKCSTTHSPSPLVLKAAASISGTGGGTGFGRGSGIALSDAIENRARRFVCTAHSEGCRFNVPLRQIWQMRVSSMRSNDDDNSHLAWQVSHS